MKLQFDPKQEYQIKAINAIVDLFDGQPISRGDFSIAIETLSSYQIERHIKRDEGERKLRLNKQVYLDPEFNELWNRIKAKTTYSVEYDTEELVKKAIHGIQEMEPIKPARIHISEAALGVEKAGIHTTVLRESGETVVFHGAVPDILAYLQDKTELTRSTFVRILKDSGRLGDFLVNPQMFMDSVVTIIERTLHKLIVDGIKYEKIAGEEYEMRLFEEEELNSYLYNRYELRNKDKSIYDAIVYESSVERKFAETLDSRDDIKFFVKLPGWFKIQTPIGPYNPDWAIVKHDESTLYLVRETKGTKDFEKLRNSEAEKIKCGRKHFEALETNVSFDVVISASEI
jgi:type III restriction enzyme